MQIIDSHDSLVLVADGEDRRILEFKDMPYSFILTDRIVNARLNSYVSHVPGMKAVTCDKPVWKTRKPYEYIKTEMAHSAYMYLNNDASKAIKLFAQNGIKRSDTVNIDLKPTNRNPENVFRIMSFDIETYSFDHNKFPDPYNLTDIIYLYGIVQTRMTYTEVKSIDRIAIFVGRQEREFMQGNIKVIEVLTEYEGIDKFIEVMHNFDPDFITGYNLNFDIGYLDRRMIFDKSRSLASERLSITTSNQQFRYSIESFGRIVVDMFEYMKSVRGVYKLERLTLNHVSKVFLNDNKVEISYKEQFEMFKQYALGLTTEFPSILIDYCVYDAELAWKLFENRTMLSYLISFSNKYAATMRTVIQGTTSEKLNPFLYTELYKMKYVYDGMNTGGKYEIGGGFVHLSRYGVFDNVVIGDFASLYPSIMSAYNICWSTRTNTCSTIKVDYKRDDIAYTEDLGFFTKAEKHGILPRMIDALVAERKVVRAANKGIDGENEQLVIKTIANALCGFLGCKSTNKYVSPLLNCAITGLGRESIKKVNSIIASKNHLDTKHIYTDTDSSMFTITVKEYVLNKPIYKIEPNIPLEIIAILSQEQYEISEICKLMNVDFKIKCGMSFCKSISGNFQSPMSFEYETYIRRGIFMKPKLYVAEKVSIVNNVVESSIKYSGCCVKKTNYSRFLKAFYIDMVNSILKDAPPIVVFRNYLVRLFEKCDQPIEEVFIDFAIETKFKNIAATSERSPMYKFYQRSAEQGLAFEDNMSVVYVMCDEDSPLKYTLNMAKGRKLSWKYYHKSLFLLAKQLLCAAPPK